MWENKARVSLAAPSPQVLPATAEAAKTEVGRKDSTLKNILLFFAAPFIGLAYIIAFPFVGLGIFAVLTVRAAMRIEAVRNTCMVMKHVAMVFAVPFIGLAYVVLLPFLGLATLAWLAGGGGVNRVKD